MKNSDRLRRELKRIDGTGYGAYKDLRGDYDFGEYELSIVKVQGDPFASPSLIKITVPQSVAKFPGWSFENKSREVALRDYLTRQFARASREIAKGNRGSGKSGLITIDTPGQEILERTSAFVNPNEVEVRFILGLPAFGRKVAGKHAESMFFDELPQIVSEALLFDNLNSDEIAEHVQTNEDADFVREKLDELGLLAFVADNSILPRRSGIDARPMSRDEAVPFKSPDSLSVSMNLPNRGEITGIGIPKGVNLIVGGGYHGKSTLLNALEMGVYNHTPNDGREFAISNDASVKIRAEDGRRIEKVNITPFIKNLPFGKSAEQFSSENASGSSSQAANIIEALEAGANGLLIDEDTSATNFMIRDRKMQELVAKEKEPITPFIDKARQLFDENGVSTVLVIGGSGDYFDVADNVICMENYEPTERTNEAKEIVQKYSVERKNESDTNFGDINKRIPVKESINPQKGRKTKIKTRGLHQIQFGSDDILLASVEQLVDESQTRAIADSIFYATKYMDNNKSLNEIIDRVIEDIDNYGLDALSKGTNGAYARFRKFEIAAAINRLRTLKVKE